MKTTTEKFGPMFGASALLLALVLAFGGAPGRVLAQADGTPVETTWHEEGSTHVTDGEGISTETSYSDTTHTSYTAPNVQTTDTGLTGGGGASYEHNSTHEYSSSNVGEGHELGGTTLENGQTVSEGQVGFHQEGSIQNEYGTVDHHVDVGASGNAQVGDNGVQVSGQLGLAAELQAASEHFGVGDENLGAGVQGSVALEAMLGASGQIGAYIDEHGITIGGEAEAGAFVSAQASVTFDANVFGLTASVTLQAEVHAGAMAHAEAIVTIGFDGKITFQLGAGLAVGIGASVGVEFSLDASALMEQLGLGSLSDLLDWIEAFREDPQAMLGELFADVRDQTLGMLGDAVMDTVNDVIDSVIEASPWLSGGMDWVDNLFGGNSDAPVADPSSSAVAEAAVMPGDGQGSSPADSSEDSSSSTDSVLPDSTYEGSQPYSSDSGGGAPADSYNRHDPYMRWSQ